MSEILGSSMIARLEAGEGMVRFKTVGTVQDVMHLVDEYRTTQERFHDLIEKEDLSVNHYEYKERLDNIIDKISAIWNNPELSYTDQEIKEIERYGMPADKFWEEAFRSGNEVLSEIASDVADIDAPVRRSQALFSRADKKATEELASALEYASDVEEAIAYAKADVMGIAGKANAKVAARSMTEEERKRADSIFAEMLSGRSDGVPDYAREPLTGADFQYITNKAIAEHPVKFMIASIREAAATYREAKAACIESGRGYETALKKFQRMAKTAALSIYDPTKDAIIAVGKAGLESIASVACSAYEKATELAAFIKKNAIQLRNALAKNADRFLDIMTYGAYSHLGMMIAEAAERYVDKTDGVYVPTEKSRAFRPLAIKCVEDITKEMAEKDGSFVNKVRNSGAVVSVEEFGEHLKERAESLWEKLCFEAVSRGYFEDKNPVEYWKNLTYELWEYPSPFEAAADLCKDAGVALKSYEAKRDALISSADKALENGAKQVAKTAREAGKCVTGACKAVGALSILTTKKTASAVIKASRKASEVAEKAAGKAHTIVQNLKADSLSMQATIFAALGTVVGKFQSKIETKKSRLMEADYRAAMEVEKLNESVRKLANRREEPKEEYVPNEELTRFLTQLEEMPPIPSLKFAKRQVEYQLEKEKRAFDKAQDKESKLLGKEEKKLDRELEKAEAKVRKAHEQLMDAKQKIETVDGMKSSLEKKASETRVLVGKLRSASEDKSEDKSGYRDASETEHDIL